MNTNPALPDGHNPGGRFPEGDAVVYCQGAFGTPNGKTAHGLVRHTRRYRVRSVIDHRHAGQDAGQVLDGRPNGIPVVASLEAALAHSPVSQGELSRGKSGGAPPLPQEGSGVASSGDSSLTHFVIGLAPDGGQLPPEARGAVLEAIAAGLHIDSGLHDFLSEDPEIAAAAAAAGVRIRDVRKPPTRGELHFFNGKIETVRGVRVALLGTDSAVGKRTTAQLLVRDLAAAGFSAELIGTGQTAWMQGVEHGIVLDSLINDFVAGEIEHAVWAAAQDNDPDVLVLEGQGSLMNPAYPGGFELLAAGRPAAIVLQHAPARRDYDGFPGYPLHPLATQIQALELLSGKPVVAVTLNHEDLDDAALATARREIAAATGLAVCDPLRDGCAAVVEALRPYLETPR
jgi:uncharacterized NAD-dependent epimerase/dehydratase family protein